MICPQCYKPIQSSENICPFCKANIVYGENNPIDKYKEKTDQIVKKAEARAEEIKERIRGGFKGPQAHVVGNTSAPKKAPPSFSYKSQERSRNDITAHNANVADASEKNIYMGEQIRNWQVSYLTEMLLTIKSNPNIVENEKYREKAGQIWPDIIMVGNYGVNGHACILDKDRVMESQGKYKYEISIYEGYVNFAYAIAACIVDLPGRMGIYDANLLRRVIETFKANRGRFTIEDLVSVLPMEKPITEFGPNASSAVFQCFAHELGHICYDHTFSETGYDFRTSTTNLEREHHADGFARIIIDRSQFRELLWKGYIQFQLITSAIDFGHPEASLYNPLTHPSRIDRLKQGIRSFPDLSKKYDIDEKWAEDVVNNIFNWLK